MTRARVIGDLMLPTPRLEKIKRGSSFLCVHTSWRKKTTTHRVCVCVCTSFSCQFVDRQMEEDYTKLNTDWRWLRKEHWKITSDRQTTRTKWKCRCCEDLQDPEIGEAFQIGAQQTGQVVPLQISVQTNNKRKEKKNVVVIITYR